jgi:hypothetical protein
MVIAAIDRLRWAGILQWGWYVVWRSDSESALHTPPRALDFGVWDFIFPSVLVFAVATMVRSDWDGGFLTLVSASVSAGESDTHATGCAMVLWVFGYSSLIWNPSFDFDDKILGFIKCYNRTFNLGMDACFAGACLGLGTPSLTRTSASTSSLVLFPTPAACIDHRGTPEHPARTCTLETDEEAICVRNQPLRVYPYFPCLQCSCCEDELSSFYCRW